ncbi:hypothetical protein ACQ4M3_19270 [Leptolyngbya sp. AN03gr2]|uniref:hypothetical protein n=1 Tax=Leptolyngbya sp. AN03gr2 TaxID=3423364 RepID=UPI003D323182
MITHQDIQSFVTTCSQEAQEVFNHLIKNDSELCDNILKRTADEKIPKYLAMTGLTTGLTGEWRSTIQTLTIEELFVIIEQANAEECNQPLYRFLKLFRPLTNLPVKWVLGIDLNALPVDKQLKAGDGVFLACLHRSL